MFSLALPVFYKALRSSAIYKALRFFLNMSSSVKRAKCLHDAWFPIPPHDVPEVNSNDAIFDWKYADGFYMEVMVKGGVWENSVACLGAQYDVC